MTSAGSQHDSLALDKEEQKRHKLRNDLATIMNNLLYYKSLLPQEVHEIIDDDIRRCKKICHIDDENKHL